MTNRCIACGAAVRYALCRSCRRRLPEWLRVPRWRDRAVWVQEVREHLGVGRAG